MSDLKYQSVEQLHASKASCAAYIQKLETQLNGQKVRLEWINHYLFQKTPQELSLREVESRLGHKLILKDTEL